MAWYDNRRGLVNGSGRFKLDVLAKYSTDGGLSFSSDFAVNDQTPGVNTPDGNILDPDRGAVNRFNGPPPTTRIGEYFCLAVWGGTASVVWNGNSFSGFNHPVGEQVWTKAFAILGSLTITGTSGDDTITVRNTAGSSDFVEVLVNGQRQYAGLWSGLSGITVAATSGNDTVNIENSAPGVPITVNQGDGTDTVNLSPAANNLDDIQGNVTVNAGTGNNLLNEFDQNDANNDTYTVTSAATTRTGSALVTYNSIQDVVINGGSGNVTYNVQNTAATTPVTIQGGSGSNTLVGSASPNTWNLTGSNAGTLTGDVIGGAVTFTAVANLTGGADTDAFIFADGQGVSGAINGDGGTNTLDFSAYSTTVVVDLQTNTVTGVGGSVSNIQNVIGGTGGGAGIYNILVGNGGNVLTGGDGRRNLLIAGGSASTLKGGSGDDILIGGTTAYDTEAGLTSLKATMDYWSGTADDYAHPGEQPVDRQWRAAPGRDQSDQQWRREHADWQ